jgi:hypothetical protein
MCFAPSAISAYLDRRANDWSVAESSAAMKNIGTPICCAALWSLMAQSVISLLRSKRSLSGVKRTSKTALSRRECWPRAHLLSVINTAKGASLRAPYSFALFPEMSQPSVALLML